MNKKHTDKEIVEKTVRDIRRKTRWNFSPEEKIRIVLEIKLLKYEVHNQVDTISLYKIKQFMLIRGSKA